MHYIRSSDGLISELKNNGAHLRELTHIQSNSKTFKQNLKDCKLWKFQFRLLATCIFSVRWNMLISKLNESTKKTFPPPSLNQNVYCWPRRMYESDLIWLMALDGESTVHTWLYSFECKPCSPCPITQHKSCRILISSWIRRLDLNLAPWLFGGQPGAGVTHREDNPLEFPWVDLVPWVQTSQRG